MLLLFINLISDCFPALALGMEDGEAAIMKRPPRNADDGIFADGLGFDVAFQGIVITVLTLASYFIGHYLEAGRWEIVNSPDGMNIGMRHISLSTCGLVDKIEQLAERDLQLTLSVSLHSPDDESRSKIMPVNRRWPVDTLLSACRDYSA